MLMVWAFILPGHSLSSLVVPLDLVDNMTTGGCLKQLRKIYELKRPEPNEVIAVF